MLDVSIRTTQTSDNGRKQRDIKEVGGTVAEAEMSPKVSGGLELETQTWDSDRGLRVIREVGLW